jgi:beta-galactosidase/beta-glucuronidase
MREKLREEKIDLTSQTWRFRPDPNNDGLQLRWHQPDTTPDNAWPSIRVGRHWEGQGHQSLDGWAWYRLNVDVPKTWAGRDVYLSFEGVDDHYEVYVNGRFAGSGGDPKTRQTAFAERKSHAVTELVRPGATCTIAVRVFDWYGAGGIHRPVTLGTAALAPEGDILR